MAVTNKKPIQLLEGSTNGVDNKYLFTALPPVKDIHKPSKDKELNQFVFESMAGATSVVLFEFPDYNNLKGSYYIVMKSIVSLSISVHRAKVPIIPLGKSTVQGFALGNKTVAGSIIKTLTFDDELDKVVSYYKTSAIAEKYKFMYDLGSKGFAFNDSKYRITQKEFDSVMRDDILPFNIHTYALSEYTGHNGRILVNSIYGCTLINEGQVQSIENLITENTFSYIARDAELGKTLYNEENFPSYPSLTNHVSGTKLLAARKR